MTAALRCLWLSAELPERPRNGGHQYSRGLRQGLAEAGAIVEAFGLGPPSGDEGPGVIRRAVPGGMRRWYGSLLSPWPNLTYMPATGPYRRAVTEAIAQRRWDVVVVDHLQMAWVAKAWPDLGRAQGGVPLVFATQNHETSVRTAVAAGRSWRSPKGAVVRLDTRKSVALEQWMVQRADAVTCITEADAAAFARDRAGLRCVVLPPGYDDPHVEPVPSAQRSRRVVIVGSFDWHVKAANLRQFVTAADPVFAAAGIRLSIVGRLPKGFAAELGELRATELLGWVDDLAEVLRDCRVAVVSEPDGGGFKMKSLDYVFHHVPLAVTTGSVEGLDPSAGVVLVERADAGSLAAEIVRRVDATDELDAVAARAYGWAADRFSWRRSGEQLAALLEQLRAAPRARLRVVPGTVGAGDS